MSFLPEGRRLTTSARACKNFSCHLVYFICFSIVVFPFYSKIRQMSGQENLSSQSASNPVFVLSLKTQLLIARCCR